jgi:peptidyl-prolyl cis-trans isomerase C
MRKICFMAAVVFILMLTMATAHVTTGFCAPKKKTITIKDVSQDKDVLVKLGNKVITKADLETRLAALPREYQNRFKTEQQKKEFLELLVQAQLLAMEAKAGKIDHEKPVAVRIEDATNGILAQEYVSRKLAGVGKTSDEEIQKYYDGHKSEFLTPAAVRAQHILVKADQKAKREEAAAAMTKATEIRKELDQGGDFAKLAEKYSDDPGSKSKGGDLGFFTRERMVPEFSNAAFSQKIGEIGSPVRSAFGFHIIKVTDKKEEKQMDFKEAKPRIQSKLEGQKRKDALDKEIDLLKKKYKVRMVANPEGK